MDKALKTISDIHEEELEEKDAEKEEVEMERDTLYHENEELKENIRVIERKLNYGIYEATFNEWKYSNGVYGECDMECPEWMGNAVDTAVAIHEQIKEKILEIQRENEELKNKNREITTANEKLKSILSEISPHFQKDMTGEDVDWSGGECDYIDEIATDKDVVWKWQFHSQMMPFDAASTGKLNRGWKSYRAGCGGQSKMSITIRNEEYTIDFDQMDKTNVETGNKRTIKRIMTGEEEKKRVEKEYESRADEYMKGMKPAELKKEYKKLLIKGYKYEKKNTKSASNAAPKIKCKGLKCETDLEKYQPSPMKDGRNNCFKQCNKNAVKEGLCAKCSQDKTGSKWNECRNGEAGKTHTFSQVLHEGTKKNKNKEWVEFIWKTHPTMKPKE